MNIPPFQDPLLNDVHQKMEEFFASADDEAIQKLLKDINYEFYSSLPDSGWEASLLGKISIPASPTPSEILALFAPKLGQNGERISGTTTADYEDLALAA
jgi:hypothetical protein